MCICETHLRRRWGWGGISTAMELALINRMWMLLLELALWWRCMDSLKEEEEERCIRKWEDKDVEEEEEEEGTEGDNAMAIT